MDRMHIKRLLTICLALMLSLSMLPAGTFALAGTDAALSQEQAGEETGSEDPQTDTSDVAASENPAEMPEGEEVVTTPQPETDGDTADKVVEERPAKEPEAAAEAEQKAAFEFADYLTSDTGVFYLPEDAEEWAPADDNVKLDPAQKVLLHIAYEIPAGKIDETNAETEYVLPEGLNLSDDEVKAANKDGSVYEGKDRKADDLRKAGTFEIKDGKALIEFSKDTCEMNSGEEASAITGFFEIEVSAADLLGFDKEEVNTYRIRWNDDSSIDTVISFEPEKIKDTEKKGEDSSKTDSDADKKGEETGTRKAAKTAKNLRGTESEPTFSVDWGYRGNGIDPMKDEKELINGGKTLKITPIDNYVYTVPVTISFKMDKLPELGSVKIVLPKNIYESWDGGTEDINASTTASMDIQRYKQYIAQFSISQMPQVDPDNLQSSETNIFGYYYEGENVILTNIQEGDNVDFTGEVSYRFWPKRIGEFDTDENGNPIFKNEFDAKLLIDGEEQKSVEKEIIIDTSIEEGTYSKDIDPQLNKTDGYAYLSWQDNWGARPSDADDYFYVVWEVSATRSSKSTQPFILTLSDETPDQGGEIVGIKQLVYLWNGSTGPRYWSGRHFAANDLSDIKDSDERTIVGMSEGLQQNYYGEDIYVSTGGTARWGVLVRYPNSILQKNEETKEYTATIHNNATITTTQSITGESLPPNEVTGEGTIRIPYETGGGPAPPLTSVGKTGPIYESARRFDTFLTLGQKYRVYGYNTGDRAWAITGEANAPSPEWDSATGTYTADPYTLELHEGQLYMFSLPSYPSNGNTSASTYNNVSFNDVVDKIELGEGDYEFNRVIISINEYDADYIALLDKWQIQSSTRTDYTKYGKVEIYLDHSTEPYGTLERTGGSTYKFSKADGTVSTGNVIGLPAGTYYIDAKYISNPDSPAYYATMGMDLNCNVLPSEAVSSRMEKDIAAGRPVSHLTDRALIELYDKDGKEVASDMAFKDGISNSANSKHFFRKTYELKPPSFSTQISKSTSGVNVDDPEKKEQKQNITIQALQRANGLNYGQAEQLQDSLKDYVLRKGTFYDLLPAGTTAENIRLSYARTRSNTGPGDDWLSIGNLGSEFNVEYEPNYNGSGQTLMKVSYELPEELNSWPVNNIYYKVVLTYTSVNSYENIIDNGISTRNTVAYAETGDEKFNRNSGQSISQITKKDYYSDIDAENTGRIIYTQLDLDWNVLKNQEATLSKRVSTEIKSDYLKENDAFFDQTYSYMIMYNTFDPDIKNLVFYDILESGGKKEDVEKPAGWQGEFRSIDLTNLAEKIGKDGNKLEPVVYYSTSEFDSYIPTEEEKNLQDSNRWTTTAPNDPSKVTAIAVDCRKTSADTDFVINDSTTVLKFILNMEAPSAPANGTWDNTKKAVNQVELYGGVNDTAEPMTSFAEVSIETTKVDVEKIWVDDNNRDDIRPDSVKIKLLKDGEEADSVDLSDDNDWKHSFLNLKKYDYSSGEQREIEYSIEEVKTDVVADEDTATTYKSVVEGDAETGYTITNTHTPAKTEITGTKIWNDGDGENRPESIEIIVTGMADGAKAVEETVKVIFEGEPGDGEVLAKEDAEGNWAFTVKGLNKLEKGVEIVYTIAEKTVDGYASKVKGDAETGFKITNTETTSVPVEKLWNDGDGENRPESIEVQLLANEKEVDGETLTLSAENEWKGEFADLPKYDEEKAPITYTVSEVSVDGYSTETAGDAEKGFVITNTELTNIPVEKVWNDGDNADNTRAESIEVQLLANEKEVDGKTLTLSAENEWKGEFTDLPKYGEDKALIVYTVSEVSVDGYSTETTGDAKEGFVITNTELTEVSVKKVWDDADDKDGIRPEELKVVLSNGTEDVAEETLNEANNWSAAVKDLPKYDSSKEAIEYTWTEKELPEGYKLTDKSVEGAVTTLTNTHVPDEDVPPACEVRISKVNEKGKAISGAVFEVYRFEDGKEVKLTQSDYGWLDANGQFTVGKQPYLLSDLEDGRYEIKEVKAPEGYRIKDKWPVTFTVRDGQIDASLNTLTSGVRYEKTGDGSYLYTITNTSIPGKGVKTGDDTHIALWLTLMLLTAGCLAGLLVYRRRRA